MAEAGWYYVDGDPPGTVRRWNGHEWIGFPIPQPTEHTALHKSAPQRPGAMAEPGPVGPNFQLHSIGTMVVLASLGALFVLAAVQLFIGADELGRAGEPDEAGRLQATLPLRGLDDYISGLAALLGAAALGIVATALLFIPWIRTAATAARIDTIKGRIRTKRSRAKRSIFAIVLQILILGLFAPVWWLLRAVLSDLSATAGGNRGLYEIVADTAMAVSIDERTGISEIDPIKILMWWALWWIPLIVGVCMWMWALVHSPVQLASLQTYAQVSGVLLILEAVSILCIVLTIHQIASRLRS